ncbi:MAG: nitrite reductase/ring-hydroxylating ferredoxin subunit [Natronomonas sp.]|jgi:nitrite reductase/ring-hydroxylating ferredoxin subunit
MTGADASRDRERVEVCPAAELPPGSRTVVSVDGHEVGVFNVEGDLLAIANACPHQLAPLCAGQLTGEVTAPAVGEYELTREHRVVRCPWHGWKFDLETGESVFNPHLRTGTYDVAVEPANGADCPEDCEYGTDLAGEAPPVDTYDAGVERDVVVVYV